MRYSVSGTPLAFVALFLATNLLFGCTPHWSKRPWSEAFVFESPHYSVRTDTSPEVARHAAETMEKALAGYCRILNCPEALPPLRVNAYATGREYEAVARNLGLGRGTSGLYSPQPPAAIHLPWRRTAGVAPEATLRHEGVHQLLDRAFTFAVPESVKDSLPPGKHRLTGVPLWLNEGLASYMEGALESGDGLTADTANLPRLKHLQNLIGNQNCPPLREVVSRQYGEPFTAAHYAVAWGLVYSLRHASDPADHQSRHQRLSRYLEASRNAFFIAPETEFPPSFLPNGHPVADFQHQWHQRLGHKSLAAFERLIAGPEFSLEQWEQDWRQRILKLPVGP